MVAEEGCVQLVEDIGQEAGVFLLFSNEQIDGVRVRRVVYFSGETAGADFQAHAIGAFAQLKPGEGLGQLAT